VHEAVVTGTNNTRKVRISQMGCTLQNSLTDVPPEEVNLLIDAAQAQDRVLK
jgi:hypothetical protein